MRYAQYDTATGSIVGTNDARVADELLPAGIAQLPMPDGLDPGNTMVDVETLAFMAAPSDGQ